MLPTAAHAAPGAVHVHGAFRLLAMLFAAGLALPAILFVEAIAGSDNIVLSTREPNGVRSCTINGADGSTTHCLDPMDIVIAAGLGTTSILGFIGALRRNRTTLLVAAGLVGLAGASGWVLGAGAPPRIGHLALGTAFVLGALIFALAAPPREHPSP